MPDRPFTPLPMPRDGIRSAIAGGRRIRRRRRAVAASGLAGVTAIGVAVAVVLGGAPTGSAQDRLVPAESPRPTGSPAGHATPAGQPVTTGTPSAAPTGSTAPSARPSPEPTSVAPTTLPGGPAYRTPDLVRTYQEDVPTGPVAHVCGAYVSNDDAPKNAAGWCQSAQVTTTSRGHDLTLQVCHDATGASELHLPRRNEAELVVRDGDRVVWRWSTDHADAAAPHTLATGASDCWSWTAPWTDVDADGRPLEPGDYTLEAWSTASELPSRPGTAAVPVR